MANEWMVNREDVCSYTCENCANDHGVGSCFEWESEREIWNRAQKKLLEFLIVIEEFDGKDYLPRVGRDKLEKMLKSVNENE
jgi:hypothetical protein